MRDCIIRYFPHLLLDALDDGQPLRGHRALAGDAAADLVAYLDNVLGQQVVLHHPDHRPPLCGTKANATVGFAPAAAGAHVGVDSSIVK